jgi:acyl-CoA reductase-like NAD-dependent aldehyde dehydrogenase
MAKTFSNFIGGRWIPAKSGRTFTNLNPATGEALGEFPDSGPEDVDAAAQAARAPCAAGSTPAPKRGELLSASAR